MGAVLAISSPFFSAVLTTPFSIKSMYGVRSTAAALLGDSEISRGVNPGLEGIEILTIAACANDAIRKLMGRSARGAVELGASVLTSGAANQNTVSVCAFRRRLNTRKKNDMKWRFENTVIKHRKG